MAIFPFIAWDFLLVLSVISCFGIICLIPAFIVSSVGSLRLMCQGTDELIVVITRAAVGINYEITRTNPQD